MTEQALAALLHQRSRASLESWLEAPLANVDRLAQTGALDAEVADELRRGFEAALELFVVLEHESCHVLSAATNSHAPR